MGAVTGKLQENKTKTILWSLTRHGIKKIKCIFGLGEERLQKQTSMIVKVIAKKEEENIPFMKCKLPAVENYRGK